MKEINDILDRLCDRRYGFESSMCDISSQQTGLATRRTRVESSIRELDYVIGYIDSEE